MYFYRVAKSQRGASLVEAAIVLPLIIFLLFGIIQWAIILMAQISVTNAAATGARLLVLENPPVNNVNIIIQTAKNTILTPLNPNLLSVTVTDSSPPLTLPKPATETVMVSCTYVLPLLAPYVVPGQSGGTLTLSSQTTVR